MDLKEEAQRKWADLITQLGRSAGNIRTDLAEKLKDIEPGLEKVSSAFVDVVSALADKGVIKQWVTGLADGLETFAALHRDEGFSGRRDGFHKMGCRRRNRSVGLPQRNRSRHAGVEELEPSERIPGGRSRYSLRPAR